MTTGAILGKDVPETEVNEHIDTDKIVDQNRLDFLSAIVKGNAEMQKGEFLPFDGDDVVAIDPDIDTDPTADPGLPANQDPDSSGDDQPTPTAAEGEPEEAMVTVKVDGKEIQVPQSEISAAGIRTYQKESAADQRLEEASKLLKEMQAERELAEKKEPPPPPQKTTNETALEAAQEAVNSKIDALSHAQAYGGPDDYKAALQDLHAAQYEVSKLTVANAVPQQPVEAAIQKEFERREVETQKANNESIIKKLQSPVESGGYKDLLDNDRMRKLMEWEADSLLSKGAPNTYETYKKAGDTVRDLFGLGKKEEPPKTAKATGDAALEAKRQRKIVAADTVKTTGAVSTAPSGDGKPTSRADVVKSGIAALRAARGQTEAF